MVSKKRIVEVYRYYVYHEPSFGEKHSIKRFNILRDRFEKILKSKKLRSIQIAMGPDQLPIQNPIYDMTNKDFNEFIADNTPAKKRKEIYTNYS